MTGSRIHQDKAMELSYPPMTLQNIKQRFGIIGNAAQLNRAIEKAMQVAPTDISVLVTGESV